MYAYLLIKIMHLIWQIILLQTTHLMEISLIIFIIKNMWLQMHYVVFIYHWPCQCRIFGIITSPVLPMKCENWLVR